MVVAAGDTDFEGVAAEVLLGREKSMLRTLCHVRAVDVQMKEST